MQVPCLQCNQEEADGCLLLHTAHAAKDGYQAVVICSEDTDVFIMLLTFHELRYHLFCAKKGEVKSHLLPPCKDCLV